MINAMNNEAAVNPSRPFHGRLCLAIVLLVSLAVTVSPLAAQPPDAEQRADQALLERPAVTETGNAEPAETSNPAEGDRLNLLMLVWTARWLMLPIILMSLVVVTLGIERALALRRSAVIPRALVEEVNRATATRGGLNPRELFHIAGESPSSSATVIQAVLLKMGRPHAEVERVATETMQRESERLYRNVRPLNLAAAVTPLIGLLGTVWGMIEAFFATANLPIGANKAESLAEGIYTALVTTAGGLVVAIPAAILAHMFEGRIQRLFTDIHELVYSRLMPHAERLEGRSTARKSAPLSTPSPAVRSGGPPTPPPIKERVPSK